MSKKNDIDNMIPEVGPKFAAMQNVVEFDW